VIHNAPSAPKLRQADPELLGELRELIGEALWSERDPRTGKGNWGALWNTALRSSPVAWQAARQTIASYKTPRTDMTVHDVGAYLWGGFTRIHVALLGKRRRQAGQGKSGR
jgi:hypothetical protein